MDIEFDAAKDATNLEKHGISLSRASEMEQAIVVVDDRFEEERLRIYGLVDDAWYCAAVTLRGDRVRIISLRRAHRKEVERHG